MIEVSKYDRVKSFTIDLDVVINNYLRVLLSQVCKKRTKAFNNLKSPKENGNSLGSRHNTKLYKHVKLLPLSAILKVVDVQETKGTGTKYFINRIEF